MASRPLRDRLPRIRRPLQRAFFAALFAGAAFLFVKHGLIVLRTDICDNNFHATAKVITLAAAGWVGMILALAGSLSVWRRSRLFPPRRAYLATILLLLPLMFYLWNFTVQYSLKRYPVSGDEISMIFQADVFSRGMLWNRTMANEIAPHFKRHHVITTPEREYSKYPPGMPLLMALFKKTVGMEWTNSALSLACFLLLFFVTARLSGSRVTALLAALLFVLSTSVIFHAGSYFSHPAVLLAVLALVTTVMAAVTTDDRRRRDRLFLLAGAIVGIVLFLRIWDAVIVAAALGLFLTRELFLPPATDRSTGLAARSRSFLRDLGLITAGAAPLILLFLAYQKIYTGSFFTTPYQLFYYQPQLLTGDRIGEINRSFDAYYEKGLLTLTPNWLKAQAQWTNKYLVWILLLLPFLKLGRLRRFEWFVVFFPIAYIAGYAIHNSGGGDSFGARYYYPALWCWFYGATETTQFVARRLWRYIHWVPYAAFLYALCIYWQEDFPGKETGIMRGVNKRFALYEHVERRVPPEEKAIVLIKRPTAMDASFFTRHELDLSDRILYGRYFVKPRLAEDLKKNFPDRKIYVFNWNKHTRQIEFDEIREGPGPEADEKEVEHTGR